MTVSKSFFSKCCEDSQTTSPPLWVLHTLDWSRAKGKAKCVHHKLKLTTASQRFDVSLPDKWQVYCFNNNYIVVLIQFNLSPLLFLDKGLKLSIMTIVRNCLKRVNLYNVSLQELSGDSHLSDLVDSCSTGLDAAVLFDWLIGVFIDTQTFSVPTSSYKTLSSDWARSVCYNRQMKGERQNEKREMLYLFPSTPPLKGTSHNRFFFPSLPRWCVHILIIGVWVGVFTLQLFTALYTYIY